jgi:hypothetical protein
LASHTQRTGDQRRAAGDDSNGSAEKGRSYVADEEIRLIFSRRPKDLADVDGQ